MNEILERLKKLDLQIENIFPVKGGDLNDTYRIESYAKKYFLKLNNAQNFPELFEKEARGLQEIENTSILSTPKIIQHGTNDIGFQFLILEWLERTEPTFESWEKFGRNLAELHQISNDQFGWKEDNYIAIILQPNNFLDNWENFYAANRILPMVKLLFDQKKLTQKEKKAAENLCKNLSEIFPKEKPALLHGDLWNGNILPLQSGEIAVIDPAIYFGHREMDLAMTSLFGGFDDRFFHAYNEVLPVQEGFEERKQFSQLFPLLVHALLFEGFYINDVQAILKKFK